MALKQPIIPRIRTLIFEIIGNKLNLFNFKGEIFQIGLK
jgi:hypothetical protein